MLTDVARDLAAMSGQTDDAKIIALINTAAHEIWDTVDLPGVLREVRVNTDNERFTTLPNDVYRIRRVKQVSSKMAIDLVTASDAYSDSFYTMGFFTWRLLWRVPLCRRITNATRLTFRAKQPLTERCTIEITGPTDVGSRVTDTLRIDANQTTVQSNDNFIDVLNISKNVVTNSDIEVLDAESNVVSVIPNHSNSPQYWLVQILERCNTVSGQYQCFDVLYKPILPPITTLKDYFPEGFEQVLLFKALEQVYLGKEDMIGTAKEYNTKALSLLAQFQVDESMGKSLRPNVKRSGWQTRLGGIRL